MCNDALSHACIANNVQTSMGRSLEGKVTGGQLIALRFIDGFMSTTRPRRGPGPGAFGGNYDQLVALKGKYEPGNLFRLNQNIRLATR
jgi:hypothetical protein